MEGCVPAASSVGTVSGMTGGDLLVGLLAFGGAVVGSAVGYAAARGAAKVERAARAREEWGRRFTAALEAATSADGRGRAVGRALLVELMRSALASEQDRREASAVLQATAVDVPDARLRLVSPDQLNEVEVVEDTGTAEKGDDT